MEKRGRGRPPKIETEKVETENTEKVETKTPKYRVRSSFFYKGVQFHEGQDIGYNEQLLKLGKIEKVD